MAFLQVLVAGDDALEYRDGELVALRAEFHGLAVAFFVIAVVVIGDVQFVLSPVVLQAAIGPIEVDIFPGIGLAVW